MDNAAYVVAGLVIILAANGLCRLAYVNEKRRTLYGTSGAWSRNKECLIAFFIGLLLGGLPAPLFLLGVICARAIGRRDAINELSGKAAAAREDNYNDYYARQRSSSLDKYHFTKNVGMESPKQTLAAAAGSPTPLRSSARYPAESNASSNAELAVMDSPEHDSVHQTKEKIPFSTVVNIEPDALALAS